MDRIQFYRVMTGLGLKNFTVRSSLGAGGLHIELGCEKGHAGGLLFSTACPALFRSSPFFAARRPPLQSSVQPAKNSRFSFGNTVFPPARPSN